MALLPYSNQCPHVLMPLNPFGKVCQHYVQHVNEKGCNIDYIYHKHCYLCQHLKQHLTSRRTITYSLPVGIPCQSYATFILDHYCHSSTTCDTQPDTAWVYGDVVSKKQTHHVVIWKRRTSCVLLESCISNLGIYFGPRWRSVPLALWDEVQHLRRHLLERGYSADDAKRKRVALDFENRDWFPLLQFVFCQSLGSPAGDVFRRWSVLGLGTARRASLRAHMNEIDYV